MLIKKIVLAASFFSVASSSWALEPQKIDTASKKFFVSADYANAEQEIGIDGFNGDESAKASSYSVRGNMWINDSVSIGVGIVNFGEGTLFEDSSYDSSFGEYITQTHKVKSSGYTLSGRFSSPQSQGPWGFYAELGLIQWNFEWNANVDVPGYGSFTAKFADDSGIGTWGGLGVTYAITPQFKIKAGGEWYVIEPEMAELGNEAFEKSKLDLQINRYNLGAEFHF